ncbi:MAG: hypothetical protein V1874_11600 [Spirochaetota bacterium]
MKKIFIIIITILNFFYLYCSNNKSSSIKSNSLSDNGDFAAVWAFPDGVSIPYRDLNNSILSGNVNIGVVAYDKDGINKVEFTLNESTTTVSNESMNPETNEYEYVLDLNPDSLSPDGEYIIKANVFNNSDKITELPDLKIIKDTAAHNVLTVGSAESYTTLNAACQVAESGDIIKVKAGSYTLPDQNYNFTNYVAIMPADGVNKSDVIIGPGTIRSAYIKFKGVTFNYPSVSASIISSSGHHIWISDCTVTGAGCDRPDNMQVGFRFYQSCNYCIVEYCDFSELSSAVIAGVASYPDSQLVNSRYIIRQNIMYNLTDQGFGIDGSDILATGNEISHTTREKAWSVSQNSQASYDFGSGQNLVFYHSSNYGTNFSEQATVTLSGTMTAQQVADMLNSNSGFYSLYIASVSSSPFPYTGNVKIETITNTEQYQFYITGTAQETLRFSDNISHNSGDLHDISQTYPSKNGTQHCDFWQSNTGLINAVCRNNKAWNGIHQGVKWGGYNDGTYQPFINVAVVNNQIALDPVNGSVNIRCHQRSHGKKFENLLFEYNTVWNGSSIFIIEENVDANNVVFRNNIFGPKTVADMSVFAPDILIDYNCYSLNPATGVNSIVDDPEFTDATAWDFSLQSGSSVKGKGNASSGISYDIKWNLRNTATPSPGAYE